MSDIMASGAMTTEYAEQFHHKITLKKTEPHQINNVIEFESAEPASHYVYQWHKIQHMNAISNSEYAHFCLYDGDQQIGYCILHGVTSSQKTVELLRIVVSPVGQGYGKRALLTIFDHVFRTLQARKLWLDVSEANERAIKLYEKLGFVREGTLRSHAIFDGKPTSMHLYGLLREEWASLYDDQADESEDPAGNSKVKVTEGVQESLRVAMAQIAVVDGDVLMNTGKHLQFIERAALQGATHVIFPELSLTGYSLTAGDEWAFSMTEEDSELKRGIIAKLRETCDKYAITAVIGLPYKEDKQLHIASVILRPGHNPVIYSKKHLHGTENDTFVPGHHDPVIKSCGKDIGFAICADTLNERHPKAAAASGVDVYMASVLISKNGYAADSQLLSQAAKNNGMFICIANFAGASGGYESAGKSAVWNKTGELVASLPDDEEGLLVVEICEKHE